jgi:hypothetical protein
MGIFLESLVALTVLAAGPHEGPNQDPSLRQHASFLQRAAEPREPTRNLPSGGTLRGKIVMIDAERGEMMLEADERTHLLHLAADTTIMRGVEAIELEALKPGDRATVFLKEEEDMGPMVSLVEVE